MADGEPTDRPAEPVGAAESAVYRDRARRLGLAFASVVDLGARGPVTSEAIRAGVFALSAASGRLAYMAPKESALIDIAGWLAAYPAAAARLRVATPSAIRAALIEAGQAQYVANAVVRLATSHPEFSAWRTVTTGQITAGIAIALAVGATFAAGPIATLVVLNLVAALLFFGVSVLRFIAAKFAARRRLGKSVAPRVGDAEMPVYTALVPLYQEATLVADLVAALDRLDWPRDRLDIKFIVEADDPATIAAVRAAVSGPPYEVVVVPAAHPRTKPKALAFALPFARGNFVTIYDAEDRPHPGQLREAFAAFCDAGTDLACLQSPLVVDCGKGGPLARLFCVEYAALFDGLLPTLAALRLPLPLGGTSNHFRRAALEAVGGWDPFNVTEDADIGIRLARCGYRVGTLELPTVEDAPGTLMAWVRQRTRWMKGWMQTWLVHMRRPLTTARQLGWRGFVGFNLIGGGMIVTALIHPIYLLTVIAVATEPLGLWGDGGVVASMVVGVNLFNLCAGYIAFIVLARRALARRQRATEAAVLFLLPLYWLLISLASYRALGQLVVRPHHWDKTPHLARTAGARPAGAAQATGKGWAYRVPI